MEIYETTKTYMTAYLLYRTRLMHKISTRNMYKYLSLKQSTYAKIEIGDLKLTLDNFFSVLESMGFTLTSFEILLNKINAIIESEITENTDFRFLVVNSEIEEGVTQLKYVNTQNTVYKFKEVRAFEDILSITAVIKIDLLLAEHFDSLKFNPFRTSR